MQTIPFTEDNFSLLCQKLEAGETFIFPSDTSYGFSASPFSQNAIKSIQTIKKRPPAKPFLLLVANCEMAEQYGKFSEIMQDFAFTRWREQKTPTTVLAPKTSELWHFFPEFPDVGLRVPTWPLLQKFLRIWKKPLISTSANISGEASLYTMKEVRQAFSHSQITFVSFGDLSRKSQSEIWKEENTKLVRVR